MFGKHFESMYEGSMVGAGAMAFAVMGYVIAKWKPEWGAGKKLLGGQVMLNPDLLGPILGEKPSEVEKAIKFLCNPDPKTSTPGENGRRLIRLGQFNYRVVNAVKYHELRNEAQRKEQNREAQERFREKQKNDPEVQKTLENLSKSMPKVKTKPKTAEERAQTHEAWSEKHAAESVEHAKLAEELRKATT